MTVRGDDDIQMSDYLSVRVEAQLFGLPIGQVRDVFVPGVPTRVPLAPREVVGLINLRGRIVTAIDMRRRLGFPEREIVRPMVVGVEARGESYGLVVDAVGELMKLDAAARQPVPSPLDAGFGGVAAGIHRLDGHLLVVLDIDRVLDLDNMAAAA
ncbi:MAG: chemotaxis protein CheW [Pseudorhodoplanes sp.]